MEVLAQPAPPSARTVARPPGRTRGGRLRRVERRCAVAKPGGGRGPRSLGGRRRPASRATDRCRGVAVRQHGWWPGPNPRSPPTSSRLRRPTRGTATADVRRPGRPTDTRTSPRRNHRPPNRVTATAQHPARGQRVRLSPTPDVPPAPAAPQDVAPAGSPGSSERRSGAVGTASTMVRPPPGVSSAWSVPPMASVNPRATARPRPTPAPRGASP